MRKYEKMSKIDTLDTLDDATNTILTINLDTLFEKIWKYKKKREKWYEGGHEDDGGFWNGDKNGGVR